jgi:hypothetical protein
LLVATTPTTGGAGWSHRVHHWRVPGGSQVDLGFFIFVFLLFTFTILHFQSSHWLREVPAYESKTPLKPPLSFFFLYLLFCRFCAVLI